MNGAEVGKCILCRTGNKWMQVSWKQEIIREKYIRVLRSKGSNAIRHGNHLIHHPVHLLCNIEFFHFHYSFFLWIMFTFVLKVFTDQLPLFFKIQMMIFFIIGTICWKLQHNYWVIRFSSIKCIPYCCHTQQRPRISRINWSNFPLKLSRLLHLLYYWKIGPRLPPLEVNSFYLFSL